MLGRAEYVGKEGATLEWTVSGSIFKLTLHKTVIYDLEELSDNYAGLSYFNLSMRVPREYFDANFKIVD